MLDEPVPAMFADYRHSHTKRWSTVTNSCNAFVFLISPGVLSPGEHRSWKSPPQSAQR
ncbi:hypothetical protein [Amycolatopsis palatopharyngis]|uniref:hypothetical protein n=1 Tax=Amycolatopsis palatopharyngis TaxID=187982 RepID=UPI0013BE8D96|nr:hypothetical protein [Amycolatopsis palatopharyngis]